MMNQTRPHTKIEKRPINGWICLDKDIEITSTQALGRLKRIIHPKKAGHAGTLDPLATGCLPIALGEATKTIQFAMAQSKIYEFDVTWGEQRSTDDLEGDVIETSTLRPQKSEIENILSQFTGQIEQTPPCFAAVKINGQRAYDIARAGNIPDIKPRTVHIQNITLIKHSQNTTTFKATCGQGVYIRALARDFGQLLQCFGYISRLRRLKVGPFTEKNMISLDKLEKIVHSADLQTVLHPLEYVLDDIPALPLSEQEVNRLKHGQTLELIARHQVERLEQSLKNAGFNLKPNENIKAFASYQDKAIALIDINGFKVKPLRILHNE